MLVPNTRAPLFTISPLPHSMGLANDVSTPPVPPYPEQIGRTSSFWKAGLQGTGCNCGGSCCSDKGLGENPAQGLMNKLTAPPSLGGPITLFLWVGGSLLAAKWFMKR